MYAMSIDVEEHFHVSAFENVINRNDWSKLPSRVVDNTKILLELFEKKNITATFFVLGWVAERNADLVKEIANKGHEVASHGYSHKLIYDQSPNEFRSETLRSKEILEDIIQKPIKGYRAASYSITKKSLWALNILSELGFLWDSSIFPIKHDKYGIYNSPSTPYIVDLGGSNSIVEFPLTTAKICGINLPVAGGGYFRQYPYPFFKWMFNKSNKNSPSIFYLHPWEVDPDQPRVSQAGLFSKFRHYTNLSKCFSRLDRLTSDFNFRSMGEILSSIDDLQKVNLHGVATN